MKKLLPITIVLVTIFTLSSCAIITVPEKPVTKTVEIPGKSKDQLYVDANNWMVSTFNNAESVIQFSDKEAGQITGKYMLSLVTAGTQYGPARYAYAIINVKVKDGASKITVTPQEFSYAKGNIYTAYSQEKMDVDINNLITDFEKGMKTEADENW